VNLKQGDLYFIGEHDLLTGAVSSYYKIGLVKESRTGDSEDRLGEHQTGNPRHLSVIKVVTAPAISNLESMVHDQFATSRIRGEWFEFSPDELAGAIVVAQDLADDQAAHVGELTAAKQLAKIESLLNDVAPNEDDVATFRRAHEAKLLGAGVKDLRQRCDAILRTAFDDGKDVKRFATLIPKQSTKFDEGALEAAHPTLYRSFIEEKKDVVGAFLLKKQGEGQDVALPGEFETFREQFEHALDQAHADEGNLEALHLARLALLRFESRAAWDLSLAKAKLQARCGAHAGIAGLVAWKRELKVKETFNKAAFKAEHPELAARFTAVVASPAFVVAPMRGYTPIPG